MLTPTPMSVTSDPALRAGAGAAVMQSALALSVGALLGGFRGAAAGVALVGAARNGQRAAQHWSHPEPAARSEAATSGTVAFIGAVVGGYFLIDAVRRRHSGKKERKD